MALSCSVKGEILCYSEKSSFYLLTEVSVYPIEKLNFFFMYISLISQENYLTTES